MQSNNPASGARTLFCHISQVDRQIRPIQRQIEKLGKKEKPELAAKNGQAPGMERHEN
jgi:hypothetical protein